jgi:hypothetical protein
MCLLWPETTHDCPPPHLPISFDPPYRDEWSVSSFGWFILKESTLCVHAKGALVPAWTLRRTETHLPLLWIDAVSTRSCPVNCQVSILRGYDSASLDKRYHRDSLKSRMWTWRLFADQLMQTARYTFMDQKHFHITSATCFGLLGRLLGCF